MSQHMDALARANEVRLRRTQLKQSIKAGEVSVAEILRDECPDWLAGMALERLILAIPRIQARLVHRMFYAIPIGLTATVGNLTVRQRRSLAERVEAWESKRPSGKRARPHVDSVSSVGRAA